MKPDPTTSFPRTFPQLRVPGITERWNAVQQQLHPHLARLADHVQKAAAPRFPRQWPLYEVSYKSQRSINRGRGKRAPIDEYHVAFDRPPRGSGILVSVNGTDRAVLVGIQLWGVRKNALRRLWMTCRPVWLPLVERIQQTGQARFARKRTRAQETEPPLCWIDQYLETRSASYLWAGFIYPWNNLPDDLEAHLVEDVLALFPLNEAIMEQAEAIESGESLLLHESRAVFAAQMVVPSIETIVEHIHAQKFTISDMMIRAYHVALQTRPLAILTGMSGTGKTRLSRLYADAVHRITTPAHTNPYYMVVSVQPDWHNARDLLGYYNALTGLYHPTQFLRFLLRAVSDPQQPYFVCLDEMNLARPEYYLAPILSALETSDHTIDLGAPSETVQTTTGEMLQTLFRLPLNVRVTGTVNVDESTHSLSDKVLDRANVIELTDIDLVAFRATTATTIDDVVWQMILQVQEIVTRAGQPAGYRTIREILDYVEQAQDILPYPQSLDLQIKQKILPKLRGEDNARLRGALGDLLSLLLGVPRSAWSRAAQVATEVVQAAPFPESAEKVRRMLERLDQDGFTDFYG